jgi:hypothetical protein
LKLSLRAWRWGAKDCYHDRLGVIRLTVRIEKALKRGVFRQFI